MAGATGALGSQICEALVAAGASVRALARDAAGSRADGLRALGVEVVEADVTEQASLAAAIAGAGTVVSTVTCFPRADEIGPVDGAGNRSLVEAAEAAGASRFVFVSFKPVPLDFPLQDAKRSVEQRLEESPLEHVVLRPGKIMDVWFSPICGFDLTARRATIFGSGEAPVSWIAARDLARIAAAAALDGPPGGSTIELGGPEALSQREVVEIFESATGGSWATETMEAHELEAIHREGETAVVRSLGALMLEAHHGAVTDPRSFADRFPFPLTTVRAFATAAAQA